MPLPPGEKVFNLPSERVNEGYLFCSEVIFYTDGIIEAEDETEEMYGTERLLNLVTGIDSAASAEDVIEAILQDVAHFVGDAERYDDMTVVAVKKL